MEGVGRRKQFFIIEKSKGGISWIRFGEGSLGTLWKGVNECCRKKVPDKWRIEWREEKRSFSLESRENKEGTRRGKNTALSSHKARIKKRVGKT